MVFHQQYKSRGHRRRGYIISKVFLTFWFIKNPSKILFCLRLLDQNSCIHFSFPKSFLILRLDGICKTLSPFRWDNFNIRKITAKLFSEVLRNNASSEENYMITGIIIEAILYFSFLCTCYHVSFLSFSWEKSISNTNTKHILTPEMYEINTLIFKWFSSLPWGYSLRSLICFVISHFLFLFSYHLFFLYNCSSHKKFCLMAPVYQNIKK